MRIASPAWIKTADRPGATVFAFMYAVESMARATLATVIPLQAYALFHEARAVSIAFLAVGCTGLVASFLIPWLIRQIRRRWVYTLGAGLLILTSLLLVTESAFGQVGGMLVRVFGGACLNITLSLYVMDYIHRRDLVVSEPRKFLFGAAAWLIGPPLGVWLTGRYGLWSACAFSAFFAVLTLANFWRLRLSDNPAVAPATRPPPSPLASIGRFAAQPRLRLAWAIAFARSSWWGVYMVYAPLLMVRGGVDPFWAALLVAAGNGLLLLARFWGKLAARLGLRPVIFGAFVVLGLATFIAGISAAQPYLAAVILLLAALCAVGLDGVGSIPFYRSVHAYERPQMTTVYRTNLDGADLISSAVFALLLTFFDLPAVFLASGVASLGASALARYLPRGM
ncbi:MAG: MFS transporter [Proteobacteria bacterium]|nr:MFS transporter [Pseudomonadota bacterium]MBI3496037.1 MFS transporter [Pseudomonadota bacterium]